MPDREKVIEGLEHGLMICEATGTELVHIKKADAEEILSLLKEQEARKKNRLPYSPDSNVQWT